MPQSSTSGLLNLAVFDFDGTLTRCDTLLPIVRLIAGRRRFWQAMPFLALDLAKVMLGLSNRDTAKGNFLKRTIKGATAALASEKARAFQRKYADKLLSPEAVSELQKRLRARDDIVIISASPELFVEPFAETLGARLLGTRLALADAALSGVLAGKNCHGEEKVYRLLEILPQPRSKYFIRAYGDSAGDKALLKLADESHYRIFNARLKDRAIATWLFLKLVA